MDNMNIIIHYFWVLKLVLLGVFLGILYRAIWVKKFKSKLCNIMAMVALVLMLVAPVKLQADTHSVYKAQEKAQEVLKVIPPKVIDDSFKEAVKDVKGISKEDLK